MNGLISVVVTTYEREDALDAVFRSLAGQEDTKFEVVLAEDGCSEATESLVERWKSRLPLAHVRHEHRGFRAGEIRNRAVLASRGDYVVFLDGDCLARPDFIATHRKLAEPGWFVTGNRALLSPELTSKVLSKQLESERWGLGQWLRQRVMGGLNRLPPILRLPLGPLRKWRPSAWKDARSCNLAVWRSDLDRVDGFDAIFNGWGKEDSDLIVRLLHSGVRRKDGACATGVLHLWHPPADRSQLPENEQKLARVIESGRVRAEQGMSGSARDGSPVIKPRLAGAR